MLASHLDTLTLARDLIARPSITPDDQGCQAHIAELLTAAGFKCESMRFGRVDNLWARYGDAGPLFVFAGHTDIVPTGPLEDWTTPPFTPTIRDGRLYGRGTSDMKVAIAAMVVAALNFVRQTPNFKGSIAFLLTSDEEGPSVDGTKKVIEVLTERGIKIDYCVIGEPSSDQTTGDQIRIGRRGSLHGKLTVHGKQGHVAHPHLAINPIHQSGIILHELVQEVWDKGNEDFPATTFQITNVHAGTGATNVIPGHLEIDFNLRFSTAVTVEELKQRILAILAKHQLRYDIHWTVGAEPFLTKKGRLLTSVQEAIQSVAGITTRPSTGGGTSDGRFIAPTGAELVELGVPHATAHMIDENISLQDAEILSGIYEKILSLTLA